MDVLNYLRLHPGEVISHEQLLNEFWQGTYTSDHAVHKAIAELRRALGDKAQSPIYIKTVPKRGYTLIAPVELCEPNDKLATSHETEPSSKPSPPNEPTPNNRKSGLYISLAALLVSVLSLLWFALAPSQNSEDEIVQLAILPFESLGLHADQQFLIEGLHDSLVNGLSKLSHLQLHDNALPISESRSSINAGLGRNTPADHVLHGSLQRYEEQLRLTIRLTRVEDGLHQYSEQFNLQVADLFGLQDQIVSNIVSALSIHLDESERSQMLDWGTTNALAYERFLRGDFHYNQFSPNDFQRAIDYHLSAIELDPDFINAYQGVATAANNLAVYSSSERIEELTALVNEMHREVARIAPDSPVLLSIKEMLLRMSGINQILQEQQLRELIIAGDSPEFAIAHYSLFLIGARLYDEAQQLLDSAHEVGQFELSPDEVWSYRNQVYPPRARLLAAQGQLQQRPYHIGFLGAVATNLAFDGRFDEARMFLARQREVDLDGISSHYTQAVIAALSGAAQLGNTLYTELMNKGPDFNYNKGALSFMLGDIETGISYWQEIPPLQKRRLFNVTHHTEKYFPQHILLDPRYSALLESLDFGTTWQSTLIEGVIALGDKLPVQLSEEARTAYDNGTLMLSNDLWDPAQWEEFNSAKASLSMGELRLH